MIPAKLKNTSERSRLVIRKFLFLKRPRSRSGSAVQSSCRTNQTMVITAIIARATMPGEVHPISSPSATTNRREASPTNIRAAPVRSKPVRVACPEVSGTTFVPRRTAKIPTGTLMKKIQCHERYWVSTPPIVGPRAVPSAARVMTIPIAFPFCSAGM